jgi:50S ribosomal subunit-associated GTPase HflX
VIDASNPDWPRQRSAVETVLHELGLDALPRLVVFNKIDAAYEPPPQDALAVSARTGAGLDRLRAKLSSIT